MAQSKRYMILVALAVALSGFVWGFDATVISGAVPFIQKYFNLTGDRGDFLLGLAVSCLGWGVLGGTAVAGFFSDRFGRKKVLITTAVLFVTTALASALTTHFTLFVIARILGGVAVGGAILIAPVYIAEISPPKQRGSLVSLNQLMIVLGISASFFSNYFLLGVGENNWRWMLGMDAVPAALYFFFLFVVPESPRWLFGQGKEENAKEILIKTCGAEDAERELVNIRQSFRAKAETIQLSQILFSFRGRLSRATYGVALIGQLAASLALASLLGFTHHCGENQSTSVIISIILLFPLVCLLVWTILAVQAKRWHDLGYSGWTVLIQLIPVIGFLIALVIGFIRGTSGPNRYGEDPLESPNSLSAIFSRKMSFVMGIALVIAFFQQITGINAIFYYLPTIFVQAGGGIHAAFWQAVLVGLVNLGMTFVAIRLVDRLGRKPLLAIGAAGMAMSLLTCSWAFHDSSYQLTEKSFVVLQENKVPAELIADLKNSQKNVFATDKEFIAALESQLGAERLKPYHDSLITAGLNIRAPVVLFAIIGFVASFAISLGPVMWVLLSEIFPNQYRGMAISVAGFWNATVSASVTLIFPWELSHLGSAGTFLGYGLMAVAALLFILLFIPETKGKTLEELEVFLIRKERAAHGKTAAELSHEIN